MQPLPLPPRGGSIDSLAAFLNLASDNNFMLVVAWLLGALRLAGPYPMLAISAEQGPAKTVLSKLVRAVLDPSGAPVRTLPRNKRELFIAAGNGHSWPSTFQRSAALALYPLPIDERRCLFDTSAVHKSGRHSVCRRPTHHSQTRSRMSSPALILRPCYPADARTDWRNGSAGRSTRFGGSSNSHAHTSLARFRMRPHMAYTCCRIYASNACRGWLTSRSDARIVFSRGGTERWHRQGCWYQS
jgi:hypothetical protein